MYSQHRPTYTLGCLEYDLTSFSYQYHNIGIRWRCSMLRSRVLMLRSPSNGVILCIDYSSIF
jgi:hypothetical protein